MTLETTLSAAMIVIYVIKQLVLYLTNRPEPLTVLHARKSSTFVIVRMKDNVVILTRSRTKSGEYDLPGGKAEKDESPVQCIKRELSEEMGLNVHDSRFREVVKFYSVWSDVEWHVTGFVITITPDEYASIKLEPIFVRQQLVDIESLFENNAVNMDVKWFTNMRGDPKRILKAYLDTQSVDEETVAPALALPTAPESEVEIVRVKS